VDYQQFINIAIGAILSVLGWFARQLWDAVQNLRKDLEKLEVDLPTHYMRKEDFKDVINEMRKEMRDNFTRLFDKIDGKADK
jgi:cell division protein FtsB